MAIRGETVGAAYVRILADGRGLARDVADEFDEVDFEALGKKKGAALAEGVDKGIKDGEYRPDITMLRRLVDQESSYSKKVADEFASQWGKELRQALVARVGNERLGNLMFELIRQDATRAGSLKAIFEQVVDDEGEVLDLRLKNYGRYVERAGDLERQLVRQKEKAADADKALADKQSRTMQNRADRFVANVARMARASAGLADNQVKNAALHRASLNRMLDDVQGLRLEFARLQGQFDENSSREITSFFDVIDYDLRRAERRSRGFSGALSILAPNIGRAFGRGSRSDVVNFAGVMVENSVRLIASVGRFANSVQNMVKFTVEGLRAGQGLFAAIGGGASKAFGGFSGLAAAVGRFAIAIPVVVIVVGTLVSALSLLLGTLTALANVISFAVVGSLSALAGALLPVAAGIGVLVGAIAALSDEQKAALKEAIKPFVEGMKEIGEAAADAIFGGDQFKRTIRDMTEALTSSNMKALVVDIADAIGDVGSSWAKSLNSPGFKSWLDAMRKTIPDQIRTLGDILRNFAAGMGGVFLALQPLVDRFLGWLEDLTAEFAEFANSPEGQTKMVDFFERAGDSAAKFGDFLGELSGLFKDLLFNATGNDVGQGLFDGLTDAIARFREYIADGKLEQWFKDAKDFAEDLGGALETLGEVLDALDSEGFRTFAGFVITVMGEWFETISNVVEVVSDLVEALEDLIALDFSGFAANLGQALGGIGVAILDAMTFGQGQEIVDGVTELGERVGGWFTDGFGEGLGGVGETITEFFGGLGETLGGVFEGLGGAISGALGPVIEAVTGFAAAIGEGIGTAFGFLLEQGRAVYDFFAPVLGPMFSIIQSSWEIFVSFLEITFSLAWLAVQTAAQSFVTFIEERATQVIGLFMTVAEPVAQFLQGLFSDAWGFVTDTATDFGNAIGGFVVGTIENLSEALDAAASMLNDIFGPAVQWVQDRLDDLWGVAQDVGGFFQGAFRRGMELAEDAIDAVGSVLGWVADRLDDAADAARRAATAISRIKPPNLGGLGGLSPVGFLLDRFTASGGVFDGMQHRIIGEAGPEAVVPLNRPLSMVDPSVRWLSAIAQGKSASAVGSGSGRTIDASGWTVVTPSANPETVAHEVLDEMAGKLL